MRVTPMLNLPPCDLQMGCKKYDRSSNDNCDQESTNEEKKAF